MISPTVSYIVPTIGRESLLDTLASIETWPGDEILVIGKTDLADDTRVRWIPCDRGYDWGATERTRGMQAASGDYLAFIDDDDVYLPGARAEIAWTIADTPGRPTLFRIVYPSGGVLWSAPVLREGNVSTQMIVIPRIPHRLGHWSPRREGDYDFLTSMGWAPSAIVWRREVIAQMGHNDGF